MNRRNPKATCETCPYYEMSGHTEEGESMGTCKRFPPWDDVYGGLVCGEHPDFFLEEPPLDVSDEKLRNLILYICKKSEDDPTFSYEKLKTLLFLIDFTVYRRTGKSATGKEYVMETTDDQAGT